MSKLSRADLFRKLNPLLYKSLESATTLAKIRGNPRVELGHWLNQILNQTDSDLHRVLRQFGVDAGLLLADLATSLEKLPAAASSLDFARDVEAAIESAWMYTSVKFNAPKIRSAYLIYGMLMDDELRRALYALSREFGRIDDHDLPAVFARAIQGSPENDAADAGVSDIHADEANAPSSAMMGKIVALKRYASNLTERARNDEIDPVFGRDDEIRQTIDILMRRRQNNPILVGEAGVGKTAIAEGFALRIAAGLVPEPLREVELYALDIGLLQAGAGMKGEFESRLKQVIEEVQASPKPIILFVDEAHTLIGAGGAAGTGDAANLLKPALARGELRTIAATTWSEYKKHIEKDPALTRRFQTVQVLEPDEDKALGMMRGLAPKLEQHHHVLIMDAALQAAVRLSHRYIPARQLPDKAVSLLDTACARVAVNLATPPVCLERVQERSFALQRELEILNKEAALGHDRAERQLAASAELADLQAEEAQINARWEQERTLIEEILAVRAKLLQASEAPVAGEAALAEDASAEASAEAAAARELRLAEIAALRARMSELEAQLKAVQADDPLLHAAVEETTIAAIISDWTGIPVGRMVKDEMQATLALGKTMQSRVVGQQHALDCIARRVLTSRAKLDNPNRPTGVFMLCGPSGVGKTETAHALAEALYGDDQNVVAINMSEFQEAHTVSTLKGAPPGYVGYGEGGVLTEAVRRRPYSVVLLDEIEKAHRDVHEMFYQVFDKGWMEDGEGRYIDFKNTLILLTSNVGSDLTMQLCRDPDIAPDAETLSQALRAPLLEVFPPAFLGRVTLVPYYPLSDAVLRQIIELQLCRIQTRMQEQHAAELVIAPEVVEAIAKRCREVESGGRVIDAIITQSILPELSECVMRAMIDGVRIEAVKMGANEQGFTFATVGEGSEVSAGGQ